MSTELDCSRYSNRNGVSCYRNSILAILQTLPIISDHIIDHEELKETINRLVKKTPEKPEEDLIINSLSFQLFKLFRISLENPNGVMNPESLNIIMSKKNPNWGMVRQQDSQEYFSDLIDKLREEQGKKVEFIGGKNFSISSEPCKVNTLKALVARNKYEELHGEKFKYLTNYYSTVGRMFDFQTINYKKCSHCEHLSSSFELNSILKLDFPPDCNNNFKKYQLKDLLEFQQQKRKLDVKNKARCSMCNHKEQLENWIKIWSSPKILVVQLKRFIMNNYGFCDRKILNHVDYPINLDIAEYFDEDSPYKDYSKYQLMGVNMHLGFSINSGHYISMVKSKNNKKWFLFNDGNEIKEVNHQNQLINNSAVLLFYYRTN